MRVASRDLQTLFSAGTLGGLPDGRLLERFAVHREEAAFEEIVRRHGPMVWGVCRRELRDHHDAEDAFQATFLVLARKARSIAHRELVANWLYGVAYQMAMKARTTRARRRMREGQVRDMPEPEVGSQEHRDDLTEWIDRELSGLPDEYRIPIVLCELEGKTHREAADQLGWPIGTVSGRLSRAKAMLAKRLTRRGVSLSVGSVAVLLAQESASASMPTRLIGSTAQAACLFAAGGTAAGMVPVGVAALTREVLKMMRLSKIRTVTTALLLGIALLAGAVGSMPHLPPQPSRAADQREKDGAELQGIWTGVVAEVGGRRASPSDNVPLPEARIRIKGGELTLRGVIYGNVIGYSASTETTFKLRADATQSPSTVDLTVPPATDDLLPTTYLGIYRLEGDDLILCLTIPNKKRPTELKTREGTLQTLLKLRRDKASEWEPLRKRLLTRQPGDDKKSSSGDQ